MSGRKSTSTVHLGAIPEFHIDRKFSELEFTDKVPRYNLDIGGGKIVQLTVSKNFDGSREFDSLFQLASPVAHPEDIFWVKNHGATVNLKEIQRTMQGELYLKLTQQYDKSGNKLQGKFKECLKIDRNASKTFNEISDLLELQYPGALKLISSKIEHAVFKPDVNTEEAMTFLNDRWNQQQNEARIAAEEQNAAALKFERDLNVSISAELKSTGIVKIDGTERDFEDQSDLDKEPIQYVDSVDLVNLSKRIGSKFGIDEMTALSHINDIVESSSIEIR